MLIIQITPVLMKNEPQFISQIVMEYKSTHHFYTITAQITKHETKLQATS